MPTLVIIYVAGGLLLTAFSIPLVLGKIPPNGLYGFRVKKTLENPDAWYPANRYTGKWLLATGLLTAITAIGMYFIPGLSVDAYALGFLAIFGVAFATSIVMSVRYINSL